MFGDKQSGAFLFRHFLIPGPGLSGEIQDASLLQTATDVTPPQAGFIGTKGNSWLECIDSLVLKEFAPWH